jgi:hypothetical protein
MRFAKRVLLRVMAHYPLRKRCALFAWIEVNITAYVMQLMQYLLNLIFKSLIYWEHFIFLKLRNYTSLHRLMDPGSSSL